MTSKDSLVKHIIKKRNINSKINNSIFEISKGKKQKKENIIKIRYLNKDYNKSKLLRIFGEKFVINNRNRCKILFSNKIIKYDIIKSEEKLIKIKLQFYDDPINLDSMFKGCTNLKDASEIKSKDI